MRAIDVPCEGFTSLGPVGDIHTSLVPDSLPLYRCLVPGIGDHFVSPEAGCEGQTTESLLGYVFP